METASRQLNCLGLTPTLDGIWSEVCDGYGDNVHASVEEIEHLVKLYNDSVHEADALVESREQASAC
jgi:hypothetical protein